MAIRQFARLAVRTAALAVAGSSLSAAAVDEQSAQSYCSHRTAQSYGYTCQGFAQVVPGLGLEPITQVGTVAGSPTGIFDGYGTVTASFGSVRQHVRGQAIFQDRTCVGRITYRVWIALPNGDGNELPPLDIDFAVVSGGDEILGSPTRFGGSGADVPRITCRLVKTKP